MAIQNFPSALQPIIQLGYLEHAFQAPLVSRLGFRAVAERETFPGNIGETLTKTRTGLLAPATTPINVQAVSPISGAAASLDNGLTPDVWGVEQYTITLNEYGKTLNLNTVTQKVGIADRFVQNATKLGENARHTMDQLCRNTVFDAYQGGNTVVRVASTGAAIPVDDVRGFTTVFVNGVQQVVSPQTSMAVMIGASLYSVTSVAVDTTNVSTSFRGMSGVLNLASGTTVTSADGAALSPVTASTAAPVTRPNARASTAALQIGDTLTMAALLNAKLNLDNNGTPLMDGMHNCYLDPTSARQLFADPDFRQLFQGATSENEVFRMGYVERPFLGLRFIRTTESPIQSHPTNLALKVHRPIILGMGALIEADFDTTNGDAPTMDDEGMVVRADGITMVTREPIDRLKQIVTQSWYAATGFCAPTDTTTTPTTVPSATNAAYKRGAVIEHV